jgi:class 3 adenylate cyclase
MPDITPWLLSLGLEKYEEILASHDIDLAVVPDLTDQDLEKLGFSLGHRRKFLSAASKLREPTAGTSELATQIQPSRPAESAMERRQMTVVFVDLVGSTVMGSELDPEDLIQLLRQYRDACVNVVGKYDGFIAQYLGDGILIYFGFPAAQEHAAERAVRAALEIVDKVAKLKQRDGQPLQTRVGIATGVVVTGEASGVGPAGEETVVGDTPNLAARLQSLAEAGCVLVSSSTHRITEDFFEYSSLGEFAIKGFREPIFIWKALRESATESRFAAAHAASSGPIVGRERELAFLDDSWRRAVCGNGHVVLLAGEAGMGKSRLLEALVERVQGPHSLLRCQCSPYHRNSELFPFKQLLRHRLDISHGITDQGNLNRIASVLSRVGRKAYSSAVLLAELLDISTEDTPASIEMTPTQCKNETLAILEDILMAPVEGPVLLLLEDAHWSDQTTQTLVERLLKRIDREHALVLITYRPELTTSWPDHPQTTVITCKQIGHTDCAHIVRNVARKMQINDALIREIVSRSDGVPLFAQELTKAVLELGAAAPGAVPLTLQDSLMARLDRLGAAKDVAQIASVFGREFSYRLLEAVVGKNDSDLRTNLGRLRDSGLIFEVVESDGETRFTFNHSLVQEAAYESLPRTRRQSLHRQIAFRLETISKEKGELEPALIAHHYSRAGEAEKSFEFLLLAADKSCQRLAFAESVATLGSALAEAERISDPRLRTRRKLDAQLKLGTTLALYKGPHTNEAGSALEVARTLAQEANAGPELFQATWGLYLNAARNQRLDKAKVIGEDLITISQDVGDNDLKYEALHHRWGYAYFIGDTADMLRYTTEGRQRYDRDRHHKFSYTFAGHDPGVCAYCVEAIALGLAGRPKSLSRSVETGTVLMESLQHPLTEAFFDSCVCTAFYVARDAQRCSEYAERLIKVSTKYELPATHAVGSFMLAAAEGLEGKFASAVKKMEPLLEAAFAYGFFGMLPGVIMADALAGCNRDDAALALVTRLLKSSLTPEAGVFVPELWRIRGELMIKQSAANLPQAQKYLETSLRMTDQQDAPIYRLRTGMTLARLLAENSQLEEAKNVIGLVGAGIPEEWTGPETASYGQLKAELGTNG